MVTVKIRGKQFPLCLTVAALDKLNNKCGGLSGLSAFLTDKALNTETLACNTAWMLGLLIQEGEENRRVCACMDGMPVEKNSVPGSEDIVHLLTPGNVAKYRLAVLEAVNESLHQDIKAKPPKNADHAELA